MTQTNDAISGAKMRKIEFSTNGSDWNDASGFVATVEPGGGDTQTGSINTADTTRPIVTVGDEAPQTITVTAVYTEGAAEIYRAARTAKAAQTLFALRWSKSGTTGERQYTTDTTYSFVQTCNPPGRPGGADPLTIQIVLITSGVDEATIS
jgi:hypothetical protein